VTGKADAAVTLVCLPFAGAGASFFRPWAALTGEAIEIVAPQLPGRDRRIDDQPHRDVPAAIEEVLPGLSAHLDPRRSLVLFGHSLGAVLAYELAYRLTSRSDDVAGLVVSGSPGPWTPRERRATGLPDEEFLLRVREFAGYSHEALADREMRQLILPTLRADVEMHESYLPRDDAPLPVPIISLRGREDHLVSSEQAGQWATATSKDFTLVEVPGGHMYLTGGAEPVLRHVETFVA
jgi:surfactin synthase thioesterase subunit